MKPEEIVPVLMIGVVVIAAAISAPLLLMLDASGIIQVSHEVRNGCSVPPPIQDHSLESERSPVCNSLTPPKDCNDMIDLYKKNYEVK